MRFGRNILILLAVVLCLAVALFIERRMRPVTPLAEGTPLFPVPTETVSEITWEGADRGSVNCQIRRDGEAWRMVRPYPGVRCDDAAVADLLDALQALRTGAYLGPLANSDFRVARHLTVRTAEVAYVRGFGDRQRMPLAQTLAEVNGALVTVDADAVAALLDRSPESLRTKTLLSLAPSRIRALEWLAPGSPLTRLTRKPNGQWEVSQPFRFEVTDDTVAEVLNALTATDTIDDYCLPADGPLPKGRPPVSDGDLSACGLDDENALRITFHVQGQDAPITLRFGRPNPDPNHPGTVFCLPNDAEPTAIVAVAADLPAYFGAEGPFAPDLGDLPILGAHTPITHLSVTRPGAPDAAIGLTLRDGAWVLDRPAGQRADAAGVKALLGSLTALAGAQAGSERPDAKRLCTLSIEGPDGDIALECFDAANGDRLIWRADQSRLYRVRAEDFPARLLGNDLRHALVDRTVLAVPATQIRQIDVRRRDGAHCAIARGTIDAFTWETRLPAGLFADMDIVNAWLARLSGLKAKRVLRDAPIALNGLAAYGLDPPLLRLTLDFDASSDGALRRVLLIGDRDPATGAAPALIQGGPVLYELAPEDVDLLLRWPMKETPND